MEGLNLKCSETKHFSTFWYRGTRDNIACWLAHRDNHVDKAGHAILLLISWRGERDTLYNLYHRITPRGVGARSHHFIIFMQFPSLFLRLTQALAILLPYCLSMATLWVEYGYTMGRVWVEYGLKTMI